jgi:hypothetical protein
MARQLHDLDKINDALADRIDALVPRLYVNADGDRRYWWMGSIQGDPGKSLRIWRTGAKAGEWCDFATGRGGRPLALVIESPFAGAGNAGDGIRWALRFLGWDGEDSETAEQKAQREADAAARRKRKDEEQARDMEWRRRAALARFMEGQPIAGTISERYLLGRAIDLKRLGRQPGALRHHSAMICPETRAPRPCLLAAVTGPDGRFMTVHRHFLEEISPGVVIKARMQGNPKQAYGPYWGGHIPLWRGESGKEAKRMPDGEWIAAAEGLEDGLTIALAQPDMRVWTSVSLGNMGAMILPAQCGGLYWHRHRGDGPEAEAQFFRAREQQQARGVRVVDLWAPGDAKDFNEWLMREAGLQPVRVAAGKKGAGA